MSNCAIVGINWGDEGKGRMVDLIAREYDIVCRYQGGNNAGHTIVNEYGKFALHLIPSGICLPGVVNVLGNGVVIDLESLWGEISELQKAGVPITPENFKISERATIVFPFHRALDGLEEARLKDKKYGSTLRGSTVRRFAGAVFGALEDSDTGSRFPTRRGALFSCRRGLSGASASAAPSASSELSSGFSSFSFSIFRISSRSKSISSLNPISASPFYHPPRTVRSSRSLRRAALSGRSLRPGADIHFHFAKNIIHKTVP